jgi:REP element-mobilizing transposase RayT
MAAVPGSAAAKEWHSRGYLPHRDRDGLLQAISFRLHDAVPGDVLDGWKRELAWVEHADPKDPRAVELRRRIEHYEDACGGACWLRDPALAGLVQNALMFFDGQRYRLLEWCVMPNHVHVLVEEMESWPVGSLAHSWKSFTAKEANKHLGRAGHFWMSDYYDRFARNETHVAAVVEYIRMNPVKASLCQCPADWHFGSAHLSAQPENAGVLPAGGQDGRAPR